MKLIRLPLLGMTTPLCPYRWWKQTSKLQRTVNFEPVILGLETVVYSNMKVERNIQGFKYARIQNIYQTPFLQRVPRDLLQQNQNGIQQRRKRSVTDRPKQPRKHQGVHDWWFNKLNIAKCWLIWFPWWVRDLGSYCHSLTNSSLGKPKCFVQWNPCWNRRKQELFLSQISVERTI
jgi:hypothetical protein